MTTDQRNEIEILGRILNQTDETKTKTIADWKRKIRQRYKAFTS